jgi:hypothetical protein
MLRANRHTSRSRTEPLHSPWMLSPILSLVLILSLAAHTARSAALLGPVQIPGSPLTILVAEDASIQVRRSGAFGSDPALNGMVYPNISAYADSGIFVRYGLETIGPNFDAHDTTVLDGRFQPWSAASTPALSGSGQITDPYRVHASLEHTSGVTLTIDVHYVNGQDKFQLSWTVCPPSGGSGFKTYLAADVQLTTTLPELSQSAFDSLTGAASAYNPTSGWSEHFKPLTPADAYMISNDIFTPTLSRPLWDAVQAGQNLPNTHPSSAEPGDNSLALQWNQTANACRSLIVEWYVLLGPQIPQLLNLHTYLPIIRK